MGAQGLWRSQLDWWYWDIYTIICDFFFHVLVISITISQHFSTLVESCRIMTEKLQKSVCTTREFKGIIAIKCTKPLLIGLKFWGNRVDFLNGRKERKGVWSTVDERTSCCIRLDSTLIMSKGFWSWGDAQRVIPSRAPPANSFKNKSLDNQITEPS